MGKLDDLVDRYRRMQGELTERAKAELERQIWETAKLKYGYGGHERYTVLSKLLDEVAHVIECRARLLSAGAPADALWRRMQEHNDLPLRRAVDMLTEARRGSRGMGRRVRRKLDQLLAEYSKLPLKKTAQGGWSRRRDPGQQTVRQRRRKTTKRAKQRRPRPLTMWAEVKGRMLDYLMTELDGLPEHEVERIYDDFESELKVSFDRVRHRVQRLKQEQKDRPPEVSRRELIEACELLGIDVPPPGQDVDLRHARKRQRALARAYHPDKHGGSEHLRDQYEAVNEAYDVVVRYSESRGRIARFEVIDGGKPRKQGGKHG